MSNDREFDNWSADILDSSMCREHSMPDADWEALVKHRLRGIYHAGARAALNRGYGNQVGPLERIQWLSEQGFGDDILALVREVEERREQAAALHSTYGVTDDAIRCMLGEGFHTAFRMATDHPYATAIHKLIKDMPPEDWGAVLSFVGGPIIAALREAEKQHKAASEQKEVDSGAASS